MREPDDSGSGPQASGIRFLVESALRKVALDKQGGDIPKSRGEWIARLCAALTDESEAAHQRVIASMVANGISSNEIYQTYGHL